MEETLARDIIFAALRFVLNGTPFSEKIREQITAESLAAAFRLSERQDLSHLVGFALQKQGCAAGYCQAYAEFEKMTLLALYSTTQIQFEQESVCTVLEQAEIPHIPLKGAVVRDYYPETWMRTSCDVDILVPPDRINDAVKALTGTLRYRAPRTKTLHDRPLVSEGGVTVELHHTLIEESVFPKAGAILEVVWETALPAPGHTYRKAMRAELFLFYHIYHMAKHFIRGGCGVRTFIDLYLLKRALPVRDDVLEGLLEGANLLTFYRACTALCEVWFDDQPHTDLTRETENFVLSGGVYGSLDNQGVIAAGSQKGKFATVWGLIFFPTERMKVLYPELETRPYLLPVCYIKRWCHGLFSKERRARILRQGNAILSVSKEETKAAKSLLSSLELEI